MFGSSNGKNGTPIQGVRQDVPILGQPASIVELQGVRLTGKVHCNCRLDNEDVNVVDGEGVCPACQKTFFIIFNPAQGRVELRIQPAATPETVSEVQP